MDNQDNGNELLYQLLKRGQIEEFNQHRREGMTCNLTGKDLRGLDLRGLDTRGLDLSNCHLRHADLRGLDLSNCPMRGASISEARISGTYFPAQLSAGEISLSLLHGTRLRYRDD